MALTALLGALALSAPAAAQDPFDDSGLVDQYREDVPTAAGPTIPGGGGNRNGSLPANVRSNLYRQAGSDAKQLEEIATSSRYGAPPSTKPPAEGLPDGASSGPLSAAVSAVADGSDGRLVGLFIALVVIAAATLGLAAGRRRHRTL